MKVNLSGFITDQTSYGLVTLNILDQMSVKDWDVRLYPDREVQIRSEFRFNLSVNKSINKVSDLTTDSIKISHPFYMNSRIVGGQHIGFTFFEVDQFTGFEKYNLNCLDKLMVTSEWAAKLCREQLSVPVFVCPLGVDRFQFNDLNFVPDKCTFLSIGKWEVRKGQDEIVSSFKKTFGNSTDVQLMMLFDTPMLDPNFIAKKKMEYKSNNVFCLPRLDSQFGVNRLLNQTYCFVSHSKAEAWNLELLEAMSCGKFCISPNSSGESTFVNEDNCLITRTHKYEYANDGRWFGQNEFMNCGNWAVPSNDSLCENMMAIYERYKKDPSAKNTEGIKTANFFNWTNTVNRLEDIINA